MSERDIFLAARGNPDPAERAAFLAKACAGDVALRERVERLLRADSKADSLLDMPALASMETDSPETGAWTPTAESDNPCEEELDDVLHFLAPADQPGVLGRMDHYDILELVGKGGMGLVLKAFDARLHRIVAIKVMAPNLAVNETARKRFVREAQAGAAINHKHVVTIHAVEAEHSPPYLVMEMVAGRSLADRLRNQGPTGVKEIVRIGSEIASGLAAAHECGLIHRDIKPANILLENRGDRVKITDFGLARAANDVGLTQSGQLAGTPKYMSPEQALGQPLDPRSDLFSLGGVLYFLCTAQAPFRADNTLAVLEQVVQGEPQPIRELNPAIPVWLCDLIKRLLAKDKAQRIQSAQEVADLLENQQAPSAPPALPFPGSTVRESSPEGIAKERMPSGKRESGAATVEWSAVGHETRAPLTIPRLRSRVWLAVAGGAVAVVALAIVLLSGWGSHRSNETKDGRRGTDPNLPGARSIGDTFDADALRAPPVKRSTHGNQLDCSCIPRGFSPDGKWLVTVSAGDPVIRVWDVSTGKQHKEIPCPGDLLPGPLFSHKGTLLAVYGIDGVVTLWDTRTFTPVRTLEKQVSRFGFPIRIRSAAFDPEDKILATGREDGVVQLWEVDTGRQVAEIAVINSPLLSLHFMPGGKRLAIFATFRPPTSNAQRDIWYYDCLLGILDIDEKSPTFKRPLHQWKALDTHFLVVSAVGEQLYFIQNRYKEDPSFGIADAATGKLREVKSLPGIVPITLVPVPGRGLLAAYSDKVARFWNTETGKVEWEVPVPSNEDHGHLVLHPDGKTVAYGADDVAGVHLIDLSTRQVIWPRR